MASNSGDINLQHITDLINQVANNQQVNPLSQNLYNELIKNFSNLAGIIKDGDKITERELGKIVKHFDNVMKINLKVGSSAEFNTLKKALADGFKEAIKQEKSISAEGVFRSFSNLGGSAIIQSSIKEQKGEKGAFLKNTYNNEKIAVIQKEMLSTMKANNNTLVGILTNTKDKILDFMGWDSAERKKLIKGLGASLIEGLEANKFAGGALRDWLTLQGLKFANWAKEHNMKNLGVAVYVALTAVVPALAGLIIKGIGFVLTGKLFPLIGKGFTSIGKGIAGLFNNLVMKMGGPLLNLLTLPKGTVSGQVLSMGKNLGKNIIKHGKGGLGALVGGFAMEAGANFAVNKGVNASLAHGLSGAGQGALTGAWLGSVIPGLGTAVGAGVGAVIGGVIGIVKGFRHDVKEHNKTAEEDNKNNKGFWERLFDWLKNSKLGKWLGGEDNEGESSGSGSSSGPVQKIKNAVNEFKTNYLGEQDRNVTSTISGLQLNKYGGMVNIGSYNKMQASELVKGYMNSNPTAFNRAYETVGSKYAYLGSFQNDLAIRDKKGNAQQAVLFKGAGQELEYIWSALQGAGMSQKQAQQLKYTSGRSTLGSPHSKSGKANSHDNIMNMVTDLGVANNWTDREWEIAFNTLKPLLAQQGFDLKWEGVDKKGKTIFGDKFVGGLSNRHFHVGLMKGQYNMHPQDADLNVDDYNKAQADAKAVQAQEQAIKAQMHSIGARELLVMQNRGDRSILDNLAPEGASEEEKLKAYEKKLKDEWQVEYDKKRDTWVIDRAGTKTDLELQFRDPTGNNDFKNFQLEYVQILANVGG